ncbi:MAG TPA: aldo/keto reductase [Amnibacterium sp.]|uniref:aldo/keto reductase n=1 Tax=Amnibacterium sp. TaxID=1872496 RepID=UPI002F91E399
MTSLAPGPVSRRIGGTGMAVYPIALDGSVFGWASDAKATSSTLDLFYAAGGDLISTADHYAGGRSEIMIGSWLSRHASRERLVVATKVGKHPDAHGLSRAAIHRAVDASLERLGTDWIDLLGLDHEDPSTPIEETLTAVQELIIAGKVGHIAASGFSADGLREAIRVAHRLEIPGISTVLPEYNLLEREPYETEVAPIALSQDLGVLPRTPLASGYLRGDFRSRHDKPASPIFAGALKYVNRRGAAVLAVLDEISGEVGQHVGRVALAWLLSKPLVAAPVVRVPTARQLADLMPAANIILTPEQLARLDAISER